MSTVIERAIAGENLSDAQYLAVYVDGADGEKVKKVATDGGTLNKLILGLLDNAPADDGDAHVAVAGHAVGIAAEALEPFDLLTITSAGKLRKLDSVGDIPFAIHAPKPRAGVLPDAAANDQIRVLLLNQAPWRQELTGSATATIGSIGSVANGTTTVSVPGAAAGDIATASPTNALTAGLGIYAYVSAANTVTVVVTNSSAGSISQPENTYNVSVKKAATLVA